MFIGLRRPSRLPGMSPSGAGSDDGDDGDDVNDGYDRSDEEDDFKTWSDKRRAAAASGDEPSPTAQTRPPRRTLTERLADAATDRETEDNADSE
jgi:hypothetical protein